MPIVFSTRSEFKNNNFQIQMDDAVKKFPYLVDKTVTGEILAAHFENKATVVRKCFNCAVQMQDQKPIGIMLNLNPLKEKGLPPCDLCVVLYKYEEKEDGKLVEFPIVEGEIAKVGYMTNYFEDIVKKIEKEEEIRIILETTAFHTELRNLSETLRDSYISFEEERYPHAKTSCRKILENLRNKGKEWKMIDGSESLCEKFNSVLNSLYSFSSQGGPHEGISTREETRFILKAVAEMFFYVNSLYKNERLTKKNKEE